MKILHTVGFGDRATVHGFRSSFRTWASECTETAHAVMELCLAHTVGNAVERAYARSDLLDKRRVLMAQWGAVCAIPNAHSPLQEPPGVCPGFHGPDAASLPDSPGAQTGQPEHSGSIPPNPSSTDLDSATVPTGRLTTAAAVALSKPGRYSDGHTLYLQVANGGAKSWIQRISIRRPPTRHRIGWISRSLTRQGPGPGVGKPDGARRGARSVDRNAGATRTLPRQVLAPRWPVLSIADEFGASARRHCPHQGRAANRRMCERHLPLVRQACPGRFLDEVPRPCRRVLQSGLPRQVRRRPQPFRPGRGAGIQNLSAAVPYRFTQPRRTHPATW